MTFWYVFGMDLTFWTFLKLYFHLGLITTPHVFYDHMTYVYSFSTFYSHVITWPREVIIALWSFIWLSEFYSTDAPPPSFSSIPSTNPPPLYSPSMLINDSPIWRRTPPSREVWLSRRSWLYPGGSSSLQTRHCQGWMGPCINEVSTTGWVILSGTLTGLGKVQLPIVVRRVVLTQSWLADVLDRKSVV